LIRSELDRFRINEKIDQMILTTEQIALVESIPGWGGWMKKMDDAEAEGRAAGDAYVKNIPEYAGMNEGELEAAIKTWDDSNPDEVGCPYTDDEDLRNEWEAAFVAGGRMELWAMLKSDDRRSVALTSL
jgi:hypothetical protein